MNKNFNGMNKIKKFLNSPYSFIFALILGVVMAVGGSVWATSVGTNVSVTGTLTIGGATITHSVAATTSILADGANSWAIATSSANIPFVKYNTSTYRIGISTTTPGATFTVGGAGNIYALATHGIFSGDAIKRIEDSVIERIFITDSISYCAILAPAVPKFVIVSVAELLGEAILRIHLNKSVSSLFEEA